jgi:hypothetical protein
MPPPVWAIYQVCHDRRVGGVQGSVSAARPWPGPTIDKGTPNHFARRAGWPVPCVRPAGYQEASPSPVYGAALLMRFGLLVHPGFKSPSLRTTCTLSGDSITGEGVRSCGRIPGLIRSARAEPMRARSSRTWGRRRGCTAPSWCRVRGPGSLGRRRRGRLARLTSGGRAPRPGGCRGRGRRTSVRRCDVRWGIGDAARFLTRERLDLVFVGHGRVDEPRHVAADLVTSEAIALPGQGCCDDPSNPPRAGGAFVVSRPGDRGGLLPCQHDDTDRGPSLASTAAACPTI